MRRIRQAKPSAAIVVAVVALVAALGGGAVAGVTISKLNKKEKKQVKRISKKQAKKLDRRIELTPGPQGPAGPQGQRGQTGPAGQDATKVFAYFGSAGNLIYGNGVTTDASKPAQGTYRIALDRDLAGCVAFANSGLGDPDGTFGSAGGDSVAKVTDITPTDTVEVAVFESDTGLLLDRAFSVAVFC